MGISVKRKARIIRVGAIKEAVSKEGALSIKCNNQTEIKQLRCL